MVIYLLRGGNLGYYLIITFVFFVLVDYKYIYSFIDSKFLYSKTGSKLDFETSKRNELHIKKYEKLDIYILTFMCGIVFVLNYTISSIVFNMNPLILMLFSKEINLKEIFMGYESQLKLVYHISCVLCVFFLTNENLTWLKSRLEKSICKILKKEEIDNKDLRSEHIIAKDNNDEIFAIEEDSLYQNVLITGSIGSGKTSGAIARFTYNLIKSGKGGLILDVKGNFVNIVEDMCKRTGRFKDLKVISQNSQSYFELLERDVSSLELANRFKRVITLLSTNNNSDDYWLDKVENTLMNFIILMKFNNNLNILELHKLITDERYLLKEISNTKERIKAIIPNDKTSFELANALSFIENEYLKLDSRVNGIIRSEITRLTIPLVTDYDIYNQFCIKEDKEKINFNSSDIVVLSLNIGENKALCKIISTFLKLSFQKYILSNISNPKPMFFIADEFQEFCNSEDAHFLSLSRESKCINIISTQSYSSLRSGLKDTNVANVIIQNLVNKIWFRNDDNYTIAEIIKQIGKVDVIKENKTVSEAATESKKLLLSDSLRNKKSSISKSLNYVVVKENEYDENFFSRELKTFEALSFFTTKEGIQLKKIIFERWK